jgi:hypothetical protein
MDTIPIGHMTQVASVHNSIQMQLMKVICNNESKMNKEFKHDVESQSLAMETILNMQIMQFVSNESDLQIRKYLEQMFSTVREKQICLITEPSNAWHPISLTKSDGLDIPSRPRKRTKEGNSPSFWDVGFMRIAAWSRGTNVSPARAADA